MSRAVNPNQTIFRTEDASEIEKLIQPSTTLIDTQREQRANLEAQKMLATAGHGTKTDLYDFGHGPIRSDIEKGDLAVKEGTATKVDTSGMSPRELVEYESTWFAERNA